MLILFDNGTPRTPARFFTDPHTVTEARARGWDRLENGDLLAAAEAAGFEVLITTDQNLAYQQNLAGRMIAIVVLGQGRWSLIRRHGSEDHRYSERGRARQLSLCGDSADRRLTLTIRLAFLTSV